MAKRNCKKCFKQFSISERAILRGRGIYCSRKCKGLGWDSSGKNNYRWKGGRIINWSGYILIKSPKHPHKDRHGYVREHRLVMEKYLGRYLSPSEDIDHKNGIKTDNRIKNLQIVTRSEHVKLEHQRGIYKNHLVKLNGGFYG